MHRVEGPKPQITDGVNWIERTSAAPWQPRAGLSAVVLNEYIYVLGGSQNDDASIIGPNGRARQYYNDVWRSLDGAVWELIAPSAGWSERPGHQCEVLRQEFVCFGGFGLVENPMDVWSTSDGVEWTLLADPPWNAEDQTQVKYDFDSITVNNNDSPIIMTFGGDRETFDFADPENYLRVDDDVWVFGPAESAGLLPVMSQCAAPGLLCVADGPEPDNTQSYARAPECCPRRCSLAQTITVTSRR